MAKLQDKFYNRVIEGELELDGDEIEAGASNGIKIFEDIQDKDGHSRFIEGIVELPEIAGVTYSYAKWSLSGSHLLFVIAGRVASGTVISSGNFGTAKLPEWILNKISPVFATNIERKLIEFWGEDVSLQTTNGYLQKVSSGISCYIGGFTLTAERGFRIAYDLLIDNE